MFQVQCKNVKDLRTLCSIPPESLKRKRVVVRCDFNVPLDNKAKIKNPIRIEKTYRTINYLKTSGAKIILISHIGRDKSDTLKPVRDFLSKKYQIKFVEDIYSYGCKSAIEEMKEGEIILIENLRKWDCEKNKDLKFAQKIANFGNLYVNDAFSVSHRDHASITGVPLYVNSCIGFQFEEEIVNLSKVFDPKRPFFVLVGGAKAKTKIKMVETLEENADNIFVGGALANDIFKVQNLEIGESLVSDMNLDQVKRLISSEKIFFPDDVITVNGYGFKKTKLINEVAKTEKIVDGGKKTFKKIKRKIKESKMIIWNGPFGWYEEGYSYLTKKVAKELSKADAFVIAGGGDTLTEISKYQKKRKFNFISLAGGAMLEFISKKTLPGIEAIKEQK